MKINKAVKTLTSMTLIMLIAKASGVFRDTLLASLYGTSFDADVFSSASRLPLLFFDFTLGAAILATFIPVFNKYIATKGKAEAIRFANNFITITTLFTVIFCVVGVVFARQIAGFMLPDFTPEKLEATAKILQILFPVIIFTTLAYSSVGLLQSFDEFNIPSLISLISNGIMILYLILFGTKFGLVGIAIAMLLGWSMQFFIQIPSLIKKGFHYKFVLDLKDSGIREVVKLAVPVLVSSWVQPICIAINMIFASGAGDGAVAALDYANKLYIIVVGVFAYAVTNFIFPRLSRLNSSEDDDAFAQTTRISVGYVIYIITPIMMLFIALSSPVISLVYERGAFNVSSVYITSRALFFYSFGMLSYGISEVMNKTFYSMRDGVTPMIASIAGIVLNIATAYVLVRVYGFGIGALALSSSVGITVTAGILLTVISVRKKGIMDKNNISNIAKILVCGVGMFFAAYYSYWFVNSVIAVSDGILFRLIKLCIAGGAGVAVYLGAGFLLRVSEQKLLIESLIRRS